MIWILVADGGNARIFETSSPHSGLRRVTEMDHPISRLKIRELVSDKPGRVFSSATRIKHSLIPEVDPHVHIEQSFAKELIQILESAWTKKRFDDLVLVAEPSFLGKLKANLSKSMASRVAAAVNKDLTYVVDREISARLKEVILDLWRDPKRWAG